MEKAGIPQRLLKSAALLQEMADVENPQQAEEGRAKVFMDHLPIVQATSRRFQGHLGIYGDETWPLPQVPDNCSVFILETNAIKIRAALEGCSAFAVTTDRESLRSEYLDVKVKYCVKREGIPAAQAPRITSFEDEKKASKAEASDAIAQMMDDGLQEGLKELEDEGKSGKVGEAFTFDIADYNAEVPSTPKSLFHSVGSTPANNSSQNSQGSVIAAGENEELDAAPQEVRPETTAERERRERWEELTSDPHFVGIGPAGPEYDAPATPDPDDGSDDNGATPEWVYRENATPDPHYDREGNFIPYDVEGSSMSFDTSAASSDDEEMRTSTHESDSGNAASQNSPGALSPPSQALSTLVVYDSEVGVTQSMIDAVMAVSRAQDEGTSRETSPSIAETMSDSSEENDEGKEKETSSNFNEQVKNKQWILRHIRDARENARQGCTGEPMGLGREKLDVARSLHNHSLTFVQSKGRRLNPPVPQPDRMPGTLTAAICSYVPLEAKSILTLTLERVDTPTSSPTQHRCILLKHFEVGLDGVEGLCQGTAKIPETLEVAAERERRVGKTGTFKQGDGGFYKALKSAQQKDQRYGKGYWYFFGVKFKQTSKERQAKMGGKWFLFGAPIEAVDHLDIRTTQENTNIVLGGGVDGSGTAVHPFTANFKRTHTLFSRGGIAPMDIWPGGDDWDDGVFDDIRAAMANHGLRVGFLYADSQSSPPKPRGFPAAGKNQDEKKRKQAGPDMTEEEMKAMGTSMASRRLSDEIAANLVTKIINDRAKADAASRSM